MFRISAIILSTIMMVGCSQQVAETPNIELQPEGDAASLVVRKFLGVCLNNMPRTDKIIASAKVLGWTPLTKDQAVMVSPADPSVEFSGWYLEEDELQFMVGVSKSVWREKLAPSCSIATSDVSPVKVKELLKAALNNPKVLDDFAEGGQQVSMFEYKSSLVDGIVIMTDASPSSVDALSISFLVPSEN